MSSGLISLSGNIGMNVIRDDISIAQKLGRPLTGNQKSFIHFSYGRDMRMQVSDITMQSRVVSEDIGLPESRKGVISSKVT